LRATLPPHGLASSVVDRLTQAFSCCTWLISGCKACCANTRPSIQVRNCASMCWYEHNSFDGGRKAYLLCKCVKPESLRCPLASSSNDVLDERKMETTMVVWRLGAVHEDVGLAVKRRSFGWKRNVLITHTGVPYKVYNSVPLVLYLKQFRTTGCTS